MFPRQHTGCLWVQHASLHTWITACVRNVRRISLSSIAAGICMRRPGTNSRETAFLQSSHRPSLFCFCVLCSSRSSNSLPQDQHAPLSAKSQPAPLSAKISYVPSSIATHFAVAQTIPIHTPPHHTRTQPSKPHGHTSPAAGFGPAGVADPVPNRSAAQLMALFQLKAPARTARESLLAWQVSHPSRASSAFEILG